MEFFYQKREEPHHTFKTNILCKTVDYIWYNSNLQCSGGSKYFYEKFRKEIPDTNNGSDHIPIITELSFQKKLKNLSSFPLTIQEFNIVPKLIKPNDILHDELVLYESVKKNSPMKDLDTKKSKKNSTYEESSLEFLKKNYNYKEETLVKVLELSEGNLHKANKFIQSMINEQLK
jgi:hypothetical protein